MKNQINTKEFESSPLIKNKPHQLSDPYHDYGKRYLEKILAKEDSELNAIDYRDLLNANVPAGNFDEVAYYLPLSIYYLCLEFDDQLEMINSWVDFIYENKSSIIVSSK